jgi:hypothetical protein
MLEPTGGLCAPFLRHQTWRRRAHNLSIWANTIVRDAARFGFEAGNPRDLRARTPKRPLFLIESRHVILFLRASTIHHKISSAASLRRTRNDVEDARISAEFYDWTSGHNGSAQSV